MEKKDSKAKKETENTESPTFKEDVDASSEPTKEQETPQSEGVIDEEVVSAESTEVAADDQDTLDASEEPVEHASIEGSIKTPKQRQKGKATAAAPLKTKKPRLWLKIGVLGVVVGIVLLAGLGFGTNRYYNHKVLPNVTVAGQPAAGKTAEQLKSQLNAAQENMKITIQAGDKTLEPTLADLGVQIDVDQTVHQALDAKRDQSIVTRLSFWKKRSVPAAVTVNDTQLTQYIEANTTELTKPAQDAQLQFDPASNAFSITAQADGQVPDVPQLTQQIELASQNLASSAITLAVVTKPPVVTQDKLQPLLQPADTLLDRKIVLSGNGMSYSPSVKEIASWVTPTPKDDGSITLVVAPGKVQSYVESIGKKISSSPVDRKVIKDESTGTELVLQEGRDGTELADKQVLTDAITKALAAEKDITLTMSIKTAPHKTVNMNGYDKWIEVDLSAQTTTAYEKATPVNKFLVATGMRGYETPVGEYAIWLKVRSQTMKGGSKADGSYYNIPNVEWVSYFYQDYALHGAWWREKFGAPASHGCVNMTNADAKWLYDWAPMGTKVVVHY